MSNDKSYPRFFIVDGLPVKLVLEGDEVAGYKYDNEPINLGKVLEGIEVSEVEYNAKVSELINST